MAKSKLRLKARELRIQGLGIKTIAHKLNVSSSTTSIWCRDIVLSPSQIAELECRSHDPFYGKRLANVQKQQRTRIEKTKNLLQRGVLEVDKLNIRELFTAGIALYWAEGFKKDNQVGFSNSDITMIKFFIIWLEKCCSVSRDRLRFRAGLNESYKNNVEKIEQYWSDGLNIPISQFQKPFFQKVRWKKVYEHPEEYHGVLRVRVSKSTDLLRLMHGWIEGVKQNCVLE